jgi:hypothetical protein
MPGALLRRSPRSPRSLLRCWAQAVRSTALRGKTDEDGVPRTGSLDATRNKPSFPRSPPLHSSRSGADAEDDRLCSSAVTTRECARLDVNFSVAGIVDPGGQRSLRKPGVTGPPDTGQIFTYMRIYRPPDCAITWQERNIQNSGVNYCDQIVGSGKTGGAAPARSIPAVAFTG